MTIDVLIGATAGAERRPIDQSKIAYQKPQPAGMVPDVFVGSALELDGDEREWVPQSPTRSRSGRSS